MVKNGPFLVTGAAGFIGAALVSKLLKKGEDVIGIDNLNDYYNVNLKKYRLNNLSNYAQDISNSWSFYEGAIDDFEYLNKLFKIYKPEVVINLAAQAGVRYSIEKPQKYIQSNLVGFGNILELSRIYEIKNLIYASSSSVYGGNKKLPFSELDQVNHPISLYAATKKSNELMAHSYSHLFKIPVTGLRFFTVYGPWGRPDMAPMLFADAILSDKPINLFNNGNMMRDFTFIDDISAAIFRCCYKPATPNKNFDQFAPDPATSFAPSKIFNIGNGRPVNLMHFIELLENSLGKKAIKNFRSMQPGDVKETSSDTSMLESWINFKPSTPIEVGVDAFAQWYLKYQKELF